MLLYKLAWMKQNGAALALEAAMAKLHLLPRDLIKSISVTRLVGFLEQQFGVKTPPRDVKIESFTSVNAVRLYLEGRLNP